MKTKTPTNCQTLPRLTFKRGDKVKTQNTEGVWTVTNFMQDGRIECQRQYGRQTAIVLFQPHELRLLDPKPERSHK